MLNAPNCSARLGDMISAALVLFVLLLLLEPPFGFLARDSSIGMVRATNSWGRATTVLVLGSAAGAGAGEARARVAKRRADAAVANFIVEERLIGG
jgi:hypothetical protein